MNEHSATPAPHPYTPLDGRTDAMVSAEGMVRPAWAAFAEAWFGASGVARGRIAADARRQLDEAGLSYNPHLDAGREHAPWRFDPAPVVISAAEWTTLSAGLVQRARLIELVLKDLYGAQNLIATGALPASLAFGAAAFVRDAARWDRPPRRRLFRYAVDVARTADGRWVVLDDHVDRPEGHGFALANRVALAQAAPELFVEAGVRRLAGHFARLQEGLEEETGIEGRIALLTPGPTDPAYFSHAYLARYLGLTLVEPGDLAVREGELHVKTLEGLRRLDVVLRSVPSLGVDPLYTPGAGAAAPAGALRAARLGRVVFANAVGAGVLDGRALAPFSAALTRSLLGEEPVLAEAPCLWLGEPAARDAFLAAPEAWRLTPLRAVARPGGAPVAAAQTDAAALARRLAREGWNWVARGAVESVTTPALLDGAAGGATGGGLAPASWAVRLFATCGGEGWRAMPGGLAMTAPPDRGLDALPWDGAAKDVWVVGDPAAAAVVPQTAATALLSRRRRTAHLRRTGRDLLSRVADNLFWLGRNAERAEAILRVLKTVIERMIDASAPDRDPELLHRLLSLRLEDPAPAQTLAAARARIARLALDPGQPLGLGRTLDAAYWNANATRAHLSRDAWRDVSALAADPVWRGAPEPGRALSLAGPVDGAIRSLAAFAGASHENMTRNFAWRFLELGRRVERAQAVAAMFSALVAEQRPNESAALYAMLQLCDSFFAYRSRYLTTPEAAPAIDLLVLDETNPRSLAFQIARMDEVMGDLPRPTPYRNPEHRLTLQLLTALRCADAAPLAAVDDAGARPALAALLADAEATLERIGDQIAKAYFAHAEPALTEVMAARGTG
ncbi:MAG: hypothetical protein EA355_09095 [Rhodobacteraceae bacterium]|nr:MAG: hypothetical protein EA355_09095 [Paracoccaceae bacterium]